MNEILFETYFRCGRHWSKKNENGIRKAGNKRWIGGNKNSHAARDWLIKMLILARLKNRLDEPIDCDINAQFIFYFPKTVFYTKKGVRKKTLGDTSNLYQGPEDCLQKARIIVNDEQICSHDGSRRLPIEGTEHYIKIILTRI